MSGNRLKVHRKGLSSSHRADISEKQTTATLAPGDISRWSTHLGMLYSGLLDGRWTHDYARSSIVEIFTHTFPPSTLVSEWCFRHFQHIVTQFHNQKERILLKAVQFLYDCLISAKKCAISHGKENVNEGSPQPINIVWNRLLDEAFAKDRRHRIGICWVLKTITSFASKESFPISESVKQRMIAILGNLLNDHEQEVRRLCVAALIPFQLEESILYAFILCFNDESPAVRREVVLAIESSSIKSNAAFERLLMARSYDVCPTVRCAVMQKFRSLQGHVSTASKRRVLYNGLNDGNEVVRKACIRMLQLWVFEQLDEQEESVLSHGRGKLHKFIDTMLEVGAETEIVLEKVIEAYMESCTVR
ncbi:merozoite organizing protein, partial [Cardiosporidium cionae]